MAALKQQWHGTLMLVGQPSEETIDGAKAMLADHLYECFGRPEVAIALHDANFAAGKQAVVPGPAWANSTSIDVLMRGVGSHGAHPEEGKDPIVMAAEIINQLQTGVSRSVPPPQPGVVTVGDIHGGTKRNSIRLQRLFAEKLDAENVVARLPIIGSEDFGVFSLREKIPAVIFGSALTIQRRSRRARGRVRHCLRCILHCSLRCLSWCLRQALRR